MAGKGSKPRPFNIDRKTYEDNWDRIFGKKDKELWEHNCSVEGKIMVGVGEECSWCGSTENEKGEYE